MPHECVHVAVQPPRPHAPSPLSWPACGLVRRPECGLAPRLPEDGPNTAPLVPGRAAQGPSVGSGKINKQPGAAGNIACSPSSDRRARTERDPRRGRLREQGVACVWGAEQTPSGHRGAGTDRPRLCLMGQSRKQEPPRSLPSRGSGHRTGREEGARRQERPWPLPHRGTLAGPCLWGLGSH